MYNIYKLYKFMMSNNAAVLVFYFFNNNFLLILVILSLVNIPRVHTCFR